MEQKMKHAMGERLYKETKVIFLNVVLLFYVKIYFFFV